MFINIPFWMTVLGVPFAFSAIVENMDAYLNQNQFARACGLRRSTVSYYLTRGKVKSVQVKKEMWVTMIPESEILTVADMVNPKKTKKHDTN